MQRHLSKTCVTTVWMLLYLDGLSLVSAQETRATASITVSGRVTDREGRLLENAIVGAWWTPENAVVDRSDTDGAFTLKLPGSNENGTRITVMAFAAGLALARQHLDVSTDTHASEFDNIELALPAAHSLTLKVEDESGQPVDRALLQAVASDAHFSKLEYFGRDELLALEVGPLESDEKGSLRIDWLPPAEHYRVSLDRDGFARETNYRVVAGEHPFTNFGGTWCGPCKRELPLLKMLHEQHQADGVVVIGVHTATGYEPDAVESDIEKYAISYPIAIDDEAQATVAGYGVSGFPTTLLIGRDGKLRRKMTDSQLLTEIQLALTSP